MVREAFLGVEKEGFTAFRFIRVSISLEEP